MLPENKLVRAHRCDQTKVHIASQSQPNRNVEFLPKDYSADAIRRYTTKYYWKTYVTVLFSVKL